MSFKHHLPGQPGQGDDTTIATAAAAPLIVSATLTQALYLQEPGTSAPISVTDINQGQIGDCFLLSAIGEIALFDPNAISNMIAQNADGTETVTLYRAASGALPGFGTTSFTPVSITVSNSFPANAVNSGGQDIVNGQQEIWAQVLEKAVATLGGGYGSIANGGDPVIALEELTGFAATYTTPGALTLSQLQADAAANDLIVMDTGYNNVGYGLYNDHAYMFEGFTTVNGATAVQLLNPWGFDNPSPIPFSLLAGQIAEIDIGQGPNLGNPSPPSLLNQTAAQTWLQGSRVGFTIAANTFVDPQHEALTYAATQADGSALPAWLSFSPATRTFSGTVPAGMQTLSLSITATDTSSLSASETFQVTVPAVAPRLTHATAAQTWTQGTQLAFAPPANTFTDPQNETLTYAATLTNGQALPAWLTCDPGAGTFSGTVPYATSVLAIRLTATDTSGLSASETFAATLAAPAPAVTDQTPNQAWIAGAAVSLALPADTFTAVPGQALGYAATLPAGLTFNAATETIGGTAPVIPGTYTIRVTATQTSRLAVSETFQAVVTASAPTVSDPTANQAWTAGQAVSLPLAADTFTDPQGEKLAYAVSGLPAGLVFNPTTATFTGQAPVIPGAYTIRVIATDASRLSATDTFQAVVTANAPAVTDPTANQAWTAWQTIALPLAADTFTDPQGEKLTLSVAGLPAGVTFNASTGTFSGHAPVAAGTFTIKVTATDTSRLSVSETFPAVVTASAPTLTGQTADQAWTAGQKLAFPLAAGTFTDPQGETLTYRAAQSNGKPLPAGMAFNPYTGAFTGTTPVATGAYGIQVTATDTSGLSTSETFNAVVSASAPTVTQTPDQAWTAGQKVSLATSFADPQNERLTYTAAQANGAALPKGLLFNSVTGAFSGTPAAPGNYTLQVTATDGSGLAAWETFNATVQAGAPAAHTMPNLLWTDGLSPAFMVPTGVFTDPQASPLTYSACEVGGADATGWLHFNPSAADFFGAVPAGLTGTIGLELIATNGYGLSSATTFGLTFVAPGVHTAAVPFTAGATELLPLPS